MRALREVGGALVDSWRYLTIIKGLQAEYAALSGLTPDLAPTPLIQLWDKAPAPDPDDDPDDEWDVPSTASVGQTSWLPDDGQTQWGRLWRLLLARKGGLWPEDRAVLVDGAWLDSVAAFKAVLDNGRGARRQLVPVTGLDRHATYQAVVAGAASHDGLGVVIRLQRDDLRLAPNALGDSVRELRRTLGHKPSEIDLVIDLGEVPLVFKERDEMTVEALMRSLPEIDNYRNVAFVATNMPRNGGATKLNDIVPFARSEWWLAHELRSRSEQLARQPVYGDYGVIHPERVESIGDSKARARIPWILYTLDGRCLSIRAKDLSRDGTVADLRRQLVRLRDDGDWSGADFSTGDAWIGGIIAGGSKAGGWQRWRSVGLAHHWSYVSRQLTSSGAL